MNTVLFEWIVVCELAVVIVSLWRIAGRMPPDSVEFDGKKYVKKWE